MGKVKNGEFLYSAYKFLLHIGRNNRKIKKYNFFFQIKKKITIPADEFLLHKCRGNRKM